VYVHPCNEPEHRLPPGLFHIYEGKRLVGAITKTDLPDGRPDHIEDMLRGNGFSGPIFRVSSRDRQSIERLRAYLLATPSTPDVGVRSARS
jgi:ethanolamine utilization protein EutP